MRSDLQQCFTLLAFVGAVLSWTSVAAAEIDAAAVRRAMSVQGRLPDDLARDSRSKPAAVIPLLQIASGAKVVDIFGSGGYYSELLAGVVGAGGEV